MPSSIATSTSPKSFKWTTQRIKSGRVHKRTTSSASSRSTKKSASHNATTNKRNGATREESIRQLESELNYTYDTLATIYVMFGSLEHAYTSCKPEMDQSQNATRLSDKEKELLTQFDDLGLQVTHLERQLVKLEKRLAELRSSAPSPVVANNNNIQQQQQDTVSCATTSPDVLFDASPIVSPATSPYLSYPSAEAVTPSSSYSTAFYPESDISLCGSQSFQYPIQQQAYFPSEPSSVLFDTSSMMYGYWPATVAPF
ncbi:predicted protein [Lichtheimia corymbifera JMRC:FSU:9682]|uniref:Uncharacterized protein n=1 Tax=Lichtheimia corymbifera JMRC:FSU:9682 TaxID=1263082 RepID=A0A068S962_9FUNG|nr:predicted protein [Lichtheimia corymbifera JMRC:FSU:9682]